jgi:hypothetical protein
MWGGVKATERAHRSASKIVPKAQLGSESERIWKNSICLPLGHERFQWFKGSELGGFGLRAIFRGAGERPYQFGVISSFLQ